MHAAGAAYDGLRLPRSQEWLPSELREFLTAPAYRTVRLAGLGAVTLVGLTSVLVLAPDVVPPPSFLDLLNVICTGFALACGVVASRRAPASARSTWRLFTLFAALWFLGDASYAVLGIVEGSVADISIADAFYVAGTAPALAALARFPVPAPERGAGWRMALDTLVLGSALVLTSYVIALDEVFGDFEVGPEGLLFSFYPVSDLLLAGMATLLILRSTGGIRPDLALVCLGFLVYAATDTGYAFALADGEAFGAAVGIGYMVAPLIVGLAALSSAATTMQTSTVRRMAPSRPAAMVPDIAVWSGLLIVLLIGVSDPQSTALAMLTLALTAIRQFVLVKDNIGLRRDLEQRVGDRTAALRDFAERHQRILDSVGEGVLGVDRVGRISFLNPAAEELLHCRSDEVVGLDACSMLKGGVPHDHDCLLTAVIETGETVRRTGVEYVRNDGTHFPVEMTAAAKYRGDDPDGAVVIFRDITEREAIEQMKQEFVVAVSHELRTPLTAMHGALEMLADGDMGELPEPAQRAVALAMRGSQRLSRLVGDILDAERLTAGTLPLALADHHVLSLLEAAAHPMGTLVGEAGMDLRVVPGEDLWVHADTDRVVQALTNLLGNAVKFSTAGTTIAVGARRAGGEVVLSVADQGRGIPDEAIEVIFERFHQVDVTDSLGGGGTGLGLAITRAIVEQHGGRIWVDSEVGVGTVFSFTLPMSAAAGAPASTGVGAREGRPSGAVVVERVLTD